MHVLELSQNGEHNISREKGTMTRFEDAKRHWEYNDLITIGLLNRL